MNHSSKPKHSSLVFSVGRSYNDGGQKEGNKKFKYLLEIKVENKRNQITADLDLPSRHPKKPRNHLKQRQNISYNHITGANKQKRQYVEERMLKKEKLQGVKFLVSCSFP